jgi:MSHA biogenesis protein MshJ
MSAALKQAWGKGAGLFNERPIRERAMLTVTSIVLISFVVWELAVTPVLTDNDRLASQLERLDQQQRTLSEQQQALTLQLSSDPSLQLRERLTSRQARLDRLDAELAETTGKLIAPRAMVRLLQDMLVAQEKLELVAVELLPPTPIFDEAADSQRQADGSGGTSDGNPVTGPLLYAHDVELVIRGGYMEVVNYVDTLESMDNRLGWVSLDYQMREYPDNEIRIRVRTLSLDQAWLGV